MLRNLLALAAAASLALPGVAFATPKAQAVGVTATIPFDPPLGEKINYRSELSDTKDGKTVMRWSMDSFRFDKGENGYRLSVEHIAHGSNETDLRKQTAMAELEKLTKRPFVLRIDEEGSIVGLENGDEYWAAILRAMRTALSDGKPSPEFKKIIEAVVSMFESMPPEVRLAQLTQDVQPLVEFANTQTTVGKPIHQQIETTSPFGGTLKQNVVISLTGVTDGVAKITIRSSVPKEELQKVTKAFLAKFAGSALKPGDVEKANAAIEAFKNFKSEAIADYALRIDDGQLESFHSIQNITIADEGKTSVRTKARSIKRVE